MVNIYFNTTKLGMETKVSNYLISYKTVENSSETILCSFKANPKPIKVEWYKDHKLLGKYLIYSLT